MRSPEADERVEQDEDLFRVDGLVLGAEGKPAERDADPLQLQGRFRLASR